MDIHEYQTKELFRGYGIAVPEGRVAHSAKQALAVAEELNGEGWVVKAQIHAGGRGKAGGVLLADRLDEVEQHANQLIGTQSGHQTDRRRRAAWCSGCWWSRPTPSLQEFYLGLVIDRASQRITLIASASGGMNIEEVASQTPEKVIRETVDPAVGLQDFQCRKIAAGIGLTGKQIGQVAKMLKKLYRCFRDKDALMAEINPLVLTADEQFLALDAKMSFDGNALYRQPEIADLRDFDEEDPKEVEASGHDLNYIALDGNVGCIVNGAGPGDGHHGCDQPLWRAAGQLPRRGRRSLAGEDRQRLPHRAGGPQRQGDPAQHLRRHQPLRLDRQRHRAGDPRSGHRRCRWWCGWPGPTWSRVWRSCRAPGSTISRPII